MNRETKPLRKFVPETLGETLVEFQNYLAPVVHRIAQILPVQLIWDLYASAPSETGGVIRFPYSRVDSSVGITRMDIWTIHKFDLKGAKYIKTYNSAAKQAFEALVWVDIGFQGLENLAVSPASRNWTSAVGHFVNAEQRAQGILTTGKQMYEECLQYFADFRAAQGITDDIFAEYKLEYLLDQFKK